MLNSINNTEATSSGTLFDNLKWMTKAKPAGRFTSVSEASKFLSFPEFSRILLQNPYLCPGFTGWTTHQKLHEPMNTNQIGQHRQKAKQQKYSESASDDLG